MKTSATFTDPGDQHIVGEHRTDSTDPAQAGLFDEPYQKHSAPSKAAAREIANASATLRLKVFNCIYARGADGATDDDVQAELDIDGSTQRPRRVSLVGLGMVRDSGRTRETRSGRQATVWVAV